MLFTPTIHQGFLYLFQKHIFVFSGLLVIGLIASGCQKTLEVDGFPPEYSGVGLELKIEEERIMVVKPLSGGPAQKAGILPGDYLVAINNHPTDAENFGEVVTKLRGATNTQVNISLERGGKQFHVILKRKRTRKIDDKYQFDN